MGGSWRSLYKGLAIAVAPAVHCSLLALAAKLLNVAAVTHLRVSSARYALVGGEGNDAPGACSATLRWYSSSRLES